MAAKRYHQSVKDRMSESRGEERHLLSHDHNSGHHRMNEGEYAGHNARRRQEMEDGGMIHEDRGAVANLPQQVMYKPYPRERDYMPEGLDDTIRGVDHQMNDLDGKKRDRGMMPKKY